MKKESNPDEYIKQVAEKLIGIEKLSTQDVIKLFEEIKGAKEYQETAERYCGGSRCLMKAIFIEHKKQKLKKEIEEYEKSEEYRFDVVLRKILKEKGYDYIGFFCEEGLAPVEKNKKWGFIDKTGKEVVPFQYDSASSFFEGLAWVLKDGKIGFIDKANKVVILFQYDSADSFSKGLARVRKDDESFYINHYGERVLS